jgi:hypothetical protein
MKTKFIVEIEHGLDWNNGYLNDDSKVVEDIKEANEWDNKESAQDAATNFNIKYGRNGRIYARVL